MANKKQIAGQLFFFGGLIIMFFTFYFINKRKENVMKDKISKNSLIAKGIIDNYVHGYKRTARYNFHFYFNGKIVYSNSSTSSFVDNYVTLGNRLLNKSFPVILNSKDSSLNKLLIVPDDFKEYGLIFPDSLRWVKELLDN